MIEPTGSKSPPEEPDGYLLLAYTIDSGVAEIGATAPIQPRAVLRFAEVVRLRDEEGAGLVNAFGLPAYRLAVGGAEWEFDVGASALGDAIVAACTDVVTASLTATGTPGERIVALLADGQPESAIRRAGEALERQRQEGSLEVAIRWSRGDIPAVAQPES